MLENSKMYRLRSKTVAVEIRVCGQYAIEVEAGSLLTIGAVARDSRMIEASCGNKKLVMFAEDIVSKGEAVPAASL